MERASSRALLKSLLWAGGYGDGGKATQLRGWLQCSLLHTAASFLPWTSGLLSWKIQLWHLMSSACHFSEPQLVDLGSAKLLRTQFNPLIIFSSHPLWAENNRPVRRFSRSTEGNKPDELSVKTRLQIGRAGFIHAMRSRVDDSDSRSWTLLQLCLTGFCILVSQRVLLHIKSQSRVISCHRLEGSRERSESQITRLLCFISLEVLFGSYVVFTS